MHIPSILAAVLVLHATTVTASTTVKSSTTVKKGEKCQFSNCEKGLYCGIADGGKPVGQDGSGVCIEIPRKEKECYDFDFSHLCETDAAYCNPTINETDQSLLMRVNCPLSCGKPKCDTTTDGAVHPSHASLVELLIGAILTWAVGHVAFGNAKWSRVQGLWSRGLLLVTANDHVFSATRHCACESRQSDWMHTYGPIWRSARPLCSHQHVYNILLRSKPVTTEDNRTVPPWIANVLNVFPSWLPWQTYSTF